jgi:hypothetical protein
MVVHDYIDSFISRQSGFFPDLFEKQSHRYLGRGLVELVDKASRHAVSNAAKHGDA